MSLWRLVPHADPADARWRGQPIWGEVVVRADTPAQARAAARQLDDPVSLPEDNGEWRSHASGFDDEQLYWVRKVEGADAVRFANERGPVIAAALARKGRYHH